MLSIKSYAFAIRIVNAQVFSGFSERIHIVLEEADETIFKHGTFIFNAQFLIFNLLMLQIDDVVVSFDVLVREVPLQSGCLQRRMLH